MNTKTQKTKKIVYVDMDNVLVDFPHGIECLSDEDKTSYKDNYDECPNIFSLMRPMPDAIESYRILHENFDTYILSTSPWKNLPPGYTNSNGCKNIWVWKKANRLINA